MAIPAALAIGVGSQLIGGIFGLGQKRQANKLERANIMPIAQVNSNIATNAAQARNMAQVGIASQQYNNALAQQRENLAGVVASASRTGRNFNLASILRTANQGTNALNSQDAVARQQNQRLAMQQNQVLAGEEQRVWNWNYAQPYLQTAQRVASLRNAGNQNIFGALGGITQMAMAATAAENGNPVSIGTGVGSGVNKIGF